MIVEKITEQVEKQIKQYPCHTNRASSLGHPCEAFLYFQRTRWSEKTLHDVGLQYIFNMGNEIEEIVYKELAKAGFQVIEQQRAFEMKEYNITGHADGYIKVEGGIYPLEIKSCSPHVFPSLSDERSIRNHKSYYVRGYLTQLNLYMYMSNAKKAVFLFKNKSTGQYKEIWIVRDDDLCEQIFAKAARINEAIETKILPECVEYDNNMCGSCGFKHLCCNSPKKASHKFVNDEETEELLEEYYNLSMYVKRYKEIDAILKTKLVDQNNIIIGNFLITGKYVERKFYNIPDEVKIDYQETRRNWRKKIEKI